MPRGARTPELDAPRAFSSGRRSATVHRRVRRWKGNPAFPRLLRTGDARRLGRGSRIHVHFLGNVDRSHADRFVELGARQAHQSMPLALIGRTWPVAAFRNIETIGSTYAGICAGSGRGKSLYLDSGEVSCVRMPRTNPSYVLSFAG